MLDTFQTRRTGNPGSLGRRLNIDLDFNAPHSAYPGKRRVRLIANLPGNCGLCCSQDKLHENDSRPRLGSP